MYDIFGDKIEVVKPQYEKIQMNPWDLVDLITRYNYLNTTEYTIFYYVKRPHVTKAGKEILLTNTIHTTLDEALSNKKDNYKIYEMTLNKSLIYMVIRILACHKDLNIYALIADSFIQLQPLTRLKFLESIIPKKNYFIRYINVKNKSLEAYEHNKHKYNLKLIMENYDLGYKDCEALIEVYDLLGIQNKLIWNNEGE